MRKMITQWVADDDNAVVLAAAADDDEDDDSNGGGRVSLTYLLICNHILDDSNFDTSNSYEQNVTIVWRHLPYFLNLFLLKLKKIINFI